VNYDRVRERISLDAVSSACHRDNFTAVLLNQIVLDVRALINDRSHFLDELRVGEHELINQNQITAFNGYTLALVATLRALSWMSS
jgi:hypothetical protein